jgi:tetratricopeptide (TPR) repeat protein
MFMWGFSRGGIMTFQAMRKGVVLRAAAVVGAPTDYFEFGRQAGRERFFRERFPDYDRRKEEHLLNRSAIRWTESINAPLLILHGGSDNLSPSQSLALAAKLGEQGKVYELVIYAKDNHPTALNFEDRVRRTVDWFKNPRTLPVSQQLRKLFAEGATAEAAVKHYRDLRRTQSDRYDFSEPELNTLGYELLGAGRVAEAVEIFRLNVEAFPEAFNTYDSLAEAYAARGERELAIKNYRRSLELNPHNTNATEKLRELEGK